jgi:RNA polymerase sigma-70 factor (ECF subfamily)
MASLLSAEAQRSLVERLLAGDRDAENELVGLFHGRLQVMFTARTRDRELARDLAQDALIACLTAIRAGQLRDPEHLGAFVHGVGRNLVNNYRRRQRSVPAEVPLDPDTMARGVEADALEEAEKRTLAQRALAALGDDERQILTLTLVDGLKPGDIAARLAVSSDVVRTRKSRALKKVIAEVQRLSRFQPDRH